MAGTAKKLLFSAVTTVVVLGLFEVVARVAPDSVTPFREDLMATARPGLLTENLDVPGWDVAKGEGVQNGYPYYTNQWRMRGPDYPPERADNVERVIFLGDSSIFGVQLEWEDTFTFKFAQKRVNRFPGVDYQVANCASPGHSTFQSIYKLSRQCLRFQPDMVVIGNQFSDSTKDTLEDKQRFIPTSNPRLIRFFEHFALFRVTNLLWWSKVNRLTDEAGVIAQVGGQDNGTVRRVSPEDYEVNMRTLVDLVREAGATPVFFLLATQMDAMNREGRQPSAEYRVIMQRLATELDVQLIDAAEVVGVQFPGRTDLFVDHVHPGPLGTTLYAELMDRDLPGPTETGPDATR